MKFSKRTEWSFETNELTKTLEELKSRGEDVLDLTVSNPTQCGLNYPAKELLAAFNKEANLIYQPAARGLQSAREAVCQHYLRKGIIVNPERVFLTASTSEAYSFLFRLLADPGDTMLFPRPSYPLFHFLADINDVDLDFYPLNYAGRWNIDIDFLDAIAPTAKGVILVHPNNPTGSCVNLLERQELNKLCRKHNIPLIVDEVFLDYPLGNKEIASFADNTDALTFVMGGLSKTLGMPQMKLSWTIINGPEDLAAEASKRLEMIADTFLSVNTPAQNALPEWLSLLPEIQSMITQRVADNRRLIQEAIKGRSGMFLLEAEGGWYAMLNLPDVKDEEEFVLGLLKNKKVFVHPGYFFDCDDDEGARLVISLLTPAAELREAFKRMLL